jgi:uncharacterized protein YjbI with pentapeptide repeats
MANEAHLAQLQQGVGAWNRWRVENPSIQLDLRGVDLSGKNLAEINLMGADLTEASLPHTNLGNAKLLSAALIGANLSGANLSGANLRSAQLVNATLIGANFSGANLRNALLLTTYFVGTELEEADFTVALIGHTTFGNVDLSRVQGLYTIHHVGPSTIGIGTLHRSHSQIPEAFLRGAGVPDDMITYSKSLVGQPFQYYSCFISYSSQDEALAQRLHADLQANGVRCWFAPEDLKIGDEFRSVIDASIQIHDRLLLILSEHSVTSR